MDQDTTGRGRAQLLIAAIIAPPTGLLAVAGLMVLLAKLGDRAADPFRGREVVFFLLLLLGAGMAYLLEFLAIWYIRARRDGRGLGTVATIVVFALTGAAFSPVAASLVLPVETAPHWLQIVGLGTFGGIISGATFWTLAPERA